MTIHSYKYYTKYSDLVKHYKELDLQKSDDLYTESHHILPKSMGGSDESTNLVRVPARVHFLLHWMLYKIYRTQSMAFAWNMMRMSNSGERYTSKSFAYIAEALSKSQMNKVMTDEQKAKISATKKGKKLSHQHRVAITKSLLGRTHSTETKNKIGSAHKGKTVSGVSKQKMSNAKKGKPAHNKGKCLTEDQKAHLSKLNTGITHSAESKLKMSLSRKGKPKSDEHRAAISAALKERHRLSLGLSTDP